MRITTVLVAAVTLATIQPPALALPLSLFNSPVTETFDTLASSGTNALLPAGWSFLEIGGTTTTTYAASTGTSTTGNTYSFGATSSTERALGMVRSGTVSTTIGTIVTNQTGATITDLAITYIGEQWRLGATGRSDRLDFAYSLDATALNSGTWTEVDELDFVAPTGVGVVGARDGNLPDNRMGLSHQLRSLSLPPGSSLMLRWSDFDAASSDDGLAIDDFSITAVQVAPSNVADALPPGVSALALGGLVVVASWRRRLPPPASGRPTLPALGN